MVYFVVFISMVYCVMIRVLMLYYAWKFQRGFFFKKLEGS
jgi:hypothetical protein